eukprot:9945169-Alexandrium_andersonii.AAC.1
MATECAPLSASMHAARCPKSPSLRRTKGWGRGSMDQSAKACGLLSPAAGTPPCNQAVSLCTTACESQPM